MDNIIIIGMPGSGKTTIGKLLAKELNKEFTDTDQVFEQTVCPNITEYFSKHGEDAFRTEETNILRNLCKKSGYVISTGGGIVERAENKEILQSGGIVVFIDRSPDHIVSDIDTETRPLLAEGKKRIFSLYERRYKKYIDFCHIRIENNSTLEVLTQKIINEVNQHND